MTPEGKVKARVKQALKRAGWEYDMLTTGGRGANGFADFLVDVWGMMALVETKAEDCNPTALQDNCLSRHAKCGACCMVVSRNMLGLYNAQGEMTPARHPDPVTLMVQILAQARKNFAPVTTGRAPPS